jgi:hypothetical protein
VPSVVRTVCNLLNIILDAGQPKRHLLTTGWSVFVSAKRLVAGDSVLFIWCVHTSSISKIVTYAHFVVPFPSDSFFLFVFLYLIVLSGMTITSFFWEFAGQVGHKLSCHLQSYQVIACILVFLLQLLMLLQQIAALQFSITQGRMLILNLFFWASLLQMF